MTKFSERLHSYWTHDLPKKDNEEEWEKMVTKLQICKQCVSINIMIDHIFHKSAKVCVGIEHENNYKVYHDALTLFISTDTYHYMKAKSYYTHMSFLQNNLSKGSVYVKRMVDMRLEVMHLNTYLNQD